MLPSEWAESHRVLSDNEAEPGPWRNARTPYLVEILDRLGPYDDAIETVFMKGSQIGGTEILLNALGFWMEHTPGRILAVQIAEEEARDFSRQRVKHLIDLTPALKQIVQGTRRGNADSVMLKEFPGGSLTFAGANAPGGLRSKPVRYLLADEIDGYTHDAGGEGDPLYLAEKRQGTFGTKAKRFLVSTPNIKQSSRIEPRFLSGDQRYFNVPCPQCGTPHVLKWENFVIPKDTDGTYRPLDSHMMCPANGCVIDNDDKEHMLAGGEWIATAPYNGFRRSYHLSSLYSPVGWLSWASIADEWLRVHKDPIQLKTFVNTVLGQTWDQEGGAGLDESALAARREQFPAKLPREIALITAGVDVQGDRLECEIVGWGEGFTSWALDYVVIPGDPTGKEIWEDLDRVLMRRFVNEDGFKHRIDAACIDSGFEAYHVYDFVKPRWARRVWAIKGASDAKRVNREIWPQAWNKSKKKDARFKLIGVDTAKRHVYTRLAKPGHDRFPLAREPWWFEQLTAEKALTKYHRGHKYTEWFLPAGKRNEALDCRVYAYAAAMGLERAGRKIGTLLAERERKRGRQGKIDTAATSGESASKRKPRGDEWIPDREW